MITNLSQTLIILIPITILKSIYLKKKLKIHMINTDVNQYQRHFKIKDVN